MQVGLNALAREVRLVRCTDIRPTTVVVHTCTWPWQAFFIAEHPHPEEFQAFDHLRIRRKAFPWGDGQHSLFHTDEANVLTDG